MGWDCPGLNVVTVHLSIRLSILGVYLRVLAGFWEGRCLQQSVRYSSHIKFFFFFFAVWWYFWERCNINKMYFLIYTHHSATQKHSEQTTVHTHSYFRQFSGYPPTFDMCLNKRQCLSWRIYTSKIPSVLWIMNDPRSRFLPVAGIQTPDAQTVDFTDSWVSGKKQLSFW